jgi:hypothetical protein
MRPRRAGSFTFSERSTDVTWTTAFEPAGMMAPFDPCTEFVTVAVNRSPGRWVFVQTREPDVRAIVVPAAMLATRPSLPRGAVSTRLPLAVVRGVLGRGVLGVVDLGRLTFPPLEDVAGTSLSCGWAVSRFASSRSRLSAAVSPARSSPLSRHAPVERTTASASGVTAHRIYFDISPPSKVVLRSLNACKLGLYVLAAPADVPRAAVIWGQGVCQP